MKRIDKLTPEHEKLLPVIRDRYINLALKGGDEVDVEAFHKGIAFVYSLAKIEAPIKIMVDSPLGMQYACHFVKAMLEPGNQVRDQVGNQVRDQVRDQVRNQVWNQVGNQVRDQVGKQVRNQVWNQVRSQVWNQVRSQVGNQVRSQVGNQVGDQVGNQVWNQVRDQVGNQVGDKVRKQVWNQVWAQVGSQVWDQVGWRVWNQVRDQVRDQKMTFEQSACIGYGYDADWLAFYQVFTELGIVKNDLLAKYDEFVSSGVWDTVMFQGVAIGCRRPEVVRRDDENQLHNDQKPAIRWRDGFELYYLDGVHLEKELWREIVSKEMSFAEIMRIENADHQAVALKYNPEAILANGAKLIDGPTSRGNELFLIENSELNKLTEFPQMYYVRMNCPTGRTFIEDVEPEYARANPYADACQAFNCSLTPEQYGMLRREG